MTRELKYHIMDSRQEICYFDDELMLKCFENYPKGVELVLRIILNDNKMVVRGL